MLPSIDKELDMTEQEISDWERELEHSQMMQMQREEIKSNHDFELGKAISLLADSATER